MAGICYEYGIISYEIWALKFLFLGSLFLYHKKSFGLWRYVSWRGVLLFFGQHILYSDSWKKIDQTRDRLAVGVLHLLMIELILQSFWQIKWSSLYVHFTHIPKKCKVVWDCCLHLATLMIHVQAFIMYTKKKKKQKKRNAINSICCACVQ